MAGVLDTFLDESSDRQQEHVFCVAGLLANRIIYRPLEVKWVERLRKDGIEYFRSSDCKSVRGAFVHLRTKCGSLEAAKRLAGAVRTDLEDLLHSVPWVGFATGVIVSEYRAVLKTFPEARRCYAEDPTVAAYQQVMYEVTRTVRRKAKGFGVTFIVDDSTYSPRIRHSFNAMKINHPTVGASANGCLPSDDKDTPALQMADLFTSLAKDMFLESVKTGSTYVDVGRWSNHIDRMGRFDAEAMLRSLARTFKSPRFLKGALARQFIPERKLSRGERKRMRRSLWSKGAQETRDA